MKISQVMSKKLITITKDEPLSKAVDIMIAGKVSGLIVVDGLGNLIGVLSEKDIFKALFPRYKQYFQPNLALNHKAIKKVSMEKLSRPIGKVMSKRIVTIKESDSLAKAASLIIMKKVNRLPVVKGKKLVGIISRRDIYHALLKKELGI